jgi:hypothetical protein
MVLLLTNVYYLLVVALLVVLAVKLLGAGMNQNPVASQAVYAKLLYLAGFVLFPRRVSLEHAPHKAYALWAHVSHGRIPSWA